MSPIQSRPIKRLPGQVVPTFLYLNGAAAEEEEEEEEEEAEPGIDTLQLCTHPPTYLFTARGASTVGRGGHGRSRCPSGDRASLLYL